MGSKSEEIEYLRGSIVTCGEHDYGFDLGMLGVNKRQREALDRKGKYFKVRSVQKFRINTATKSEKLRHRRGLKLQVIMRGAGEEEARRKC